MDPLASEVLAWYVDLASRPETKAHAWHMVNEFAQQHPAVFGDLPEALKAEMARRKEKASEPDSRP